MGEPGGIGTSAVTAEERLVYQGEVFINFRTSRQWVLCSALSVATNSR